MSVFLCRRGPGEAEGEGVCGAAHLCLGCLCGFGTGADDQGLKLPRPPAPSFGMSGRRAPSILLSLGRVSQLGQTDRGEASAPAFGSWGKGRLARRCGPGRHPEEGRAFAQRKETQETENELKEAEREPQGEQTQV